MIFSKYIKKTVFVLCALIITTALAVPAGAVKVQVFKAGEEGVSTKNLRAEAVSQAFAQALLAESVRMIPVTLSADRTEALKSMFGSNYESFITGYKDMDVKYHDDGVTIRIDVNVNRATLRDSLRKMGLFASADKFVKSSVVISNGTYKLNAKDQAARDAKVKELMSLYAVQEVSAGTVDPLASTLKITQVGKKNFSGSLDSPNGKWYSAGNSVISVWGRLWAKYYKSARADDAVNPKAVLVVNGWFNPDGVREFGRLLKSWDSAVQEVQLLDVEMKPTAVSASWSLDVSDQWVLKRYLNDFLPPRGLSYRIDGLSEEK
ncbi:MAG: hypothetical protein BA863_15085 [Desulfovibrio sp. S3730MH75]|nr:MAG: hypothetical protein BA863_15085 [Desulfovibrio sp. S3730MH75]